AELLAARARDADADGTALEQQVLSYRRALALERDLAERARLNARLRELLRESARLPDAIAVAEEYVASAPMLSTYLRDRRDEAAAFAHALRAEAGGAEATLGFFRDLVARKPQAYEHRVQLADALMMAGRHAEAIDVLEQAQRILRAGGSGRTDFDVRIAEARLALGDNAAAAGIIEGLDLDALRGETLRRGIRLLAALGRTDEAERRASELPAADTQAERADVAFTRGWVLEHAGRAGDAAEQYRSALAADPHHRGARAGLDRLRG
ncbi:MAG: hypothetical protein ACRELD_12770, partial [Longimicrobiales bacterium]